MTAGIGGARADSRSGDSVDADGVELTRDLDDEVKQFHLHQGVVERQPGVLTSARSLQEIP